LATFPFKIEITDGSTGIRVLGGKPSNICISLRAVIPRAPFLRSVLYIAATLPPTRARSESASGQQHSRVYIIRRWTDGTEGHKITQGPQVFFRACGLTVAETDQLARVIERDFEFLPDNREVHDRWRALLVAYKVQGVQVHDARLAASMYVHGVGQILTFNVRDFRRFDGLRVMHPADVREAQ
jgi:hypothetical protein